MHDLTTLINSSTFNISPEAPTRIAMVHRSFRAVSLRRGITRQRFAAHFPALGLLNLAHALREDAAAGRLQAPVFRYFDEENHPGEESLVNAVTEWLDVAERRVIAASAYTMTIDYLEAFLAKFPRGDYLSVVGGAHASVAPNISNAHIVVRGEGGAALRHILTTFYMPEFGQGPEARGICYSINGEDHFSPPAFDRSIEVLPPPGFAYDLLAEHGPIYATNFTRMLGKNPQIYICTQSCRARCTFCSTYLIHGRPVARPVSFIHDDLDYLIKHLKHDSIEFHDDDLLQHPDFTGLLTVMAEMGVPWFCYGRADAIDRKLAARMADAGCRKVFLGLESMNQTNLDYYNKASTVEQNREAAEALADAGIGVVAGFIIGSPHDTVESILDDLEQFLKLPLLAINCSILSPDPGTVEFQRARKRLEEMPVALGRPEQKRLLPNPEVFGLEAPMGFPAVCKEVGKSDLNLLQAVIDAEFYFRPHIWEALTEGQEPPQVEVVREYYQFLHSTVAVLDPEGCVINLSDVVRRAKARVNEDFWQTRLGSQA
jgi:anaerobic magnesium-protoporphyrin IX monomethyl ester cyclase